MKVWVPGKAYAARRANTVQKTVGRRSCRSLLTNHGLNHHLVHAVTSPTLGVGGWVLRPGRLQNDEERARSNPVVWSRRRK